MKLFSQHQNKTLLNFHSNIVQYFDCVLSLDAGKFKAGETIPQVLVQELSPETYIVFRDEDGKDIAHFKLRSVLEEIPLEDENEPQDTEVLEDCSTTNNECEKEENLPLCVLVP